MSKLKPDSTMTRAGSRGNSCVLFLKPRFEGRGGRSLPDADTQYKRVESGFSETG